MNAAAPVNKQYIHAELLQISFSLQLHLHAVHTQEPIEYYHSLKIVTNFLYKFNTMWVIKTRC